MMTTLEVCKAANDCGDARSRLNGRSIEEAVTYCSRHNPTWLLRGWAAADATTRAVVTDAQLKAACEKEPRAAVAYAHAWLAEKHPDILKVLRG